jgi:transmembrane sensor
MSTERYDKIDAIAGDWLARRDSGAWTDQDQRHFDQWLDESPLHRVSYLRIEHVWERSERLKALGAGVPPGVIPQPNEWNLSPFFEQRKSAGDPEPFDAGAIRAVVPAKIAGRSRHWFRALAASIVVTAALAATYHFWPAPTSYRTPIGGLASVPISDGSKVTLNTDSEIRVAVTERERRIDLEHGEAFFEVAHDKRRPFVVRAGNKRVIAVGTKFSVRREANDIQVVVTEGKVLVETEGAGVAGSAEPLAAGTFAQASDAGVLLQTKRLAEAEETLSWRQGVLVFREMTLADASAEFNRYNSRKIVIEDPAVASLRVAGSFRANNVEAFVRLLERGYPLHAEEQGDQFVLSSR